MEKKTQSPNERIEALEDIKLRGLYLHGYAFSADETPIVFEDRRFGSSKINLKEGFVALWALLYASIRR